MEDVRVKELQKALGTALYPLGVTVHESELLHAAREEYYLVFDVDAENTAWANDAPLMQEVYVTLRYYARHAPVPQEHIDSIYAVMAKLGYKRDGIPIPAPTLAPTDYVGEITDWIRTDVVQ